MGWGNYTLVDQRRHILERNIASESGGGRLRELSLSAQADKLLTVRTPWLGRPTCCFCSCEDCMATRRGLLIAGRALHHSSLLSVGENLVEVGLWAYQSLVFFAPTQL